MARIVKIYCSVIARFRLITHESLCIRVAVGKMLAIFKSQESKDFNKAMDLLECSRTLMSSAIETLRAIEETNNEDPAELLALVATVKLADAFLRQYIGPVSNKISVWKLQMQQYEPVRYRKIERIINNAEKNLRAAREKSIDINYWVQFDRSGLLPLSSYSNRL